MSRGALEHVLAVAKKKPRIQQALDDLENLTEEDINNLSNIPGWIKRHLITHQKTIQKRAAGYLTPEEIAEIMIKKSLDPST